MRWAILLRAVNVGGTKKVPSAELRGAALDAGFTDPQTYLASGNLIVSPGDSGAADASEAATMVTAALAQRLDVRTDAVGIDGASMSAILAANPFVAEAAAQPSFLLVAFHPAPTGHTGAVDVAETRREQVHTHGSATYVWYPDGSGRSRLTGPRLERMLGTWSTTRNWRTVEHLAGLLGHPEATDPSRGRAH